MYTQAQEEAMDRARTHEAMGFAMPGMGGFQRCVSWMFAGWWGAKGKRTVSAPGAARAPREPAGLLPESSSSESSTE